MPRGIRQVKLRQAPKRAWYTLYYIHTYLCSWHQLSGRRFLIKMCILNYFSKQAFKPIRFDQTPLWLTTKRKKKETLCFFFSWAFFHLSPIWCIFFFLLIWNRSCQLERIELGFRHVDEVEVEKVLEDNSIRWSLCSWILSTIPLSPIQKKKKFLFELSSRFESERWRIISIEVSSKYVCIDLITMEVVWIYNSFGTPIRHGFLE